MEGSDVCFAPVLALDEVHNHAHNVARGSFIDIDGIVQPAPAPRFSRSEVGVSHGSRIAGEDTLTVLQEAGLSEAEINELVESIKKSFNPRVVARRQEVSFKHCQEIGKLFKLGRSYSQPN